MMGCYTGSDDGRMDDRMTATRRGPDRESNPEPKSSHVIWSTIELLGLLVAIDNPVSYEGGVLIRWPRDTLNVGSSVSIWGPSWLSPSLQTKWLSQEQGSYLSWPILHSGNIVTYVSMTAGCRTCWCKENHRWGHSWHDSHGYWRPKDVLLIIRQKMELPQTCSPWFVLSESVRPVVNTTNSGSNRWQRPLQLQMQISMMISCIGIANDLMHICQDYSYLGACNISMMVKNLEGESTTKCYMYESQNVRVEAWDSSFKL